MDSSRKALVNFSSRLPLSGNERPVSKTIKPSQIHRDFSPFRTTAAFIVTPNSEMSHSTFHTPDNRFSPVSSVRSSSSNLMQARFLRDGNIPAQLVASHSIAEVPVQTHAVHYQRSDVVLQAREKMNSTARMKITGSKTVPPKRFLDFTPYTYQDYKKLKPNLSITLRGLGPYTIGTEEWSTATQKMQRIKEFSKTLRRVRTIAE